MAGGIGSRFWPMSRADHPKQFHDVLSTGRTLIQATYDRIAEVLPAEHIFVVTNAEYTSQVEAQLPELRKDRILAEPVGRNTAPCLLFALKMIHAEAPNAPVLATPADHLVNQTGLFASDMELALESVVESEILMTIGIPPTRPETGYGYIQYIKDKGAPLSPVFKVKTFTEKPDAGMAEAFLKSGDFLWNSGILCGRADVLLESFRQHLTDIHDLFADVRPENCTPERIREIYLESRSVSIDYGILEHSDQVHVIPARFDWNDLGTWSSIYPFLPKDFLKNASDGKVLVVNARENLVKTPKDKLTVILGVNELIIVDTGDVLLVCPRSQEQSLRDVVGILRMEKDKYGHYL